MKKHGKINFQKQAAFLSFTQKSQDVDEIDARLVLNKDPTVRLDGVRPHSKFNYEFDKLIIL